MNNAIECLPKSGALEPNIQSRSLVSRDIFLTFNLFFLVFD